MKIRLNPEEELSTSRIERDMAISVSQGEAKSQFLKILKSRNLAQFSKFLPNSWHVSSIFKYVQLVYSNIRPKTNPSLISKGGVSDTPPQAWDEIETPWEIGLKVSNDFENQLIDLNKN